MVTNKITEFNNLAKDTFAYCPLCGVKNDILERRPIMYFGGQSNRIFDFTCISCKRKISFTVVGGLALVIVVRYRSDSKKRLDSVVKMLDHHISILNAKLLHIIHSYNPDTEFLYNFEKKLEVVRSEIEYAVKLKNRLMKLYDIIEQGEDREGMVNDIIIEGLKKAYEVGFKKGFRIAKLEDMPWLSKHEYYKEMRECENKQQQHTLKQLQRQIKQQRQQKI